MNMPNGSITFQFARTLGQAFHTNAVGTNASAVAFSPSVAGSMLLVPLRIPLDLDQTYPSTLYADLNATVDNALPGLSAILQANATVCPRDGAWFELDTECAFPIPNPWSFLDTTRVYFDDGSGVTFPGGTLIADAMLGLRMRRIPGDARDNYDKEIRALASLTLVYHRRCQKVYC